MQDLHTYAPVATCDEVYCGLRHRRVVGVDGRAELEGTELELDYRYVFMYRWVDWVIEGDDRFMSVSIFVHRGIDIRF